MKVFNTSFTLNSEEGTEVTDITKLVRESVQQFPISAGIALINTLHTTCAVFINEFQSALIVQATTSFPVAILAEAALAYLGLGTQPPHPSWGLMLKEAQNFLGMNPWFAVFPGAAIALAVLGLNLLGDGLRDLLDPKTV